MDDLQLAVELGRGALLLALKLALPAAAVALAAGLTVAVLQAATQVQEQTLSAVPRLVAAGAALFLLLPWMTAALVEYARGLFTDMAGWMP
jgi:flagellar biosynthetic protein FliQ